MRMSARTRLAGASSSGPGLVLRGVVARRPRVTTLSLRLWFRKSTSRDPCHRRRQRRQAIVATDFAAFRPRREVNAPNGRAVVSGGTEAWFGCNPTWDL